MLAVNFSEVFSRPGHARKRVAFLRRFHRDWATTAYLRRSFRNRRGYLKRGLDETGAGPSNSRHAEGGDDIGDIEIDNELAQESDEGDFTDGIEDDENEEADEGDS